MSEHTTEKDAGRPTVAEAIAAWEAKGPTSLTVALMSEALYGVREVCDQVEANPVGWGGAPVVSLVRTLQTRVTPPTEGRPVQGCMACATYRAEGRACPTHRTIPPGGAPCDPEVAT